MVPCLAMYRLRARNMETKQSGNSKREPDYACSMLKTKQAEHMNNWVSRYTSASFYKTETFMVCSINPVPSF